jgi:hypothetical protein
MYAEIAVMYGLIKMCEHMPLLGQFILFIQEKLEERRFKNYLKLKNFYENNPSNYIDIINNKFVILEKDVL